MTAKRWSYSAGERGFSCVRAYEDKRGGILVEFYERDPTRQGTRRVRFSLGHHHRKRARQKVNQIVAALERGEAVAADDVTLRQLFDIYEGEVTPTKAPDSRRHDRLCIAMFTQCFGASRRVSTLNRRDWDNFIRLRRGGSIGPSGRPVRDRQIEYDLKFLRAVFNWAMAARHNGRILLGQNPFHGKAYRLPTEKNPSRRVMTEPQYQALRKIAATMDWRFAVALDLANETGHRRNAIRLLRWSDVDPNATSIHSLIYSPKCSRLDAPPGVPIP